MLELVPVKLSHINPETQLLALPHLVNTQFLCATVLVVAPSRIVTVVAALTTYTRYVFIKHCETLQQQYSFI